MQSADLHRGSGKGRITSWGEETFYRHLQRAGTLPEGIDGGEMGVGMEVGVKVLHPTTSDTLP